jgi:murein L,D-transpeptidase YcbB/YkuD
MSAEAHGLRSEWYHVELLQQLMNKVLTSSDSAELDEALARMDVLLSDAILLYARQLRFGVFKPTQLDDAYHLPFPSYGLRELLEPLSTSDILAYLRNIQPSEPRYRALMKEMQSFREMRGEYRWPRIPALPVDKIVAGDTSSVLPMVAYRLMLTGELFATLHAPLPGVFLAVDLPAAAFRLDSTRLNALGPISYDSTLVHAVMRYQERHGLLIDGVIGSRTIARMNRGIDEYIDQMAVNLERFRWLRYPDHGRYIVVNIPDYRLRAVENGEVQTAMAVCVGERKSVYYTDKYQQYRSSGARRYEPKNHETPQLHGQFSHFILNPIWNVPGSIASRELYFSALKDSSYLKKRNYKVYYRDSVVDASTIKWSEHNPFSMPYKFKQEPGAGNALGAIKFMFLNDFSIYLHDTPQQWAFKRSVRAVSHGCVRIQEPMHFAKFLLSGTPEWDVAKIQRTIWSGVRSKPVFLHKKTPLYIDYCTAWVDENGVVQFRDDIYRKDQDLLRAMTRYDQRLRKKQI